MGSYGEPEELETRLIMEKDFDHLRLDLDPTFTKALSGDEIRDGLGFITIRRPS